MALESRLEKAFDPAFNTSEVLLLRDTKTDKIATPIRAESMAVIDPAIWLIVHPLALSCHDSRNFCGLYGLCHRITVACACRIISAGKIGPYRIDGGGRAGCHLTDGIRQS